MHIQKANPNITTKFVLATVAIDLIVSVLHEYRFIFTVRVPYRTFQGTSTLWQRTHLTFPLTSTPLVDAGYFRGGAEAPVEVGAEDLTAGPDLYPPVNPGPSQEPGRDLSSQAGKKCYVMLWYCI